MDSLKATENGQPTICDENDTGADSARALGTAIAVEEAGTVLTVTGVSKRFHARPPWHRRRIDILDGLSLEVRRGELVGLVGENGSGKSTLMQVVVGMIGRD